MEKTAYSIYTTAKGLEYPRKIVSTSQQKKYTSFR